MLMKKQFHLLSEDEVTNSPNSVLVRKASMTFNKSFNFNFHLFLGKMKITLGLQDLLMGKFQ